MAKSSPASGMAHFILVVSAMFLPTLSLLPLGGLYLWEKGWLLWWALAAFATVSLVALMQRIAFGAAAATVDQAAAMAKPADASWGDLEQRAWADVNAIASRASLENFTDPQEFLDLGRQTIEAVARRIHPEKTDALWQFTLPEALAIAERVSRQLGTYVENRIPFGTRMTLAQFWAIYRWRRGIEIAEKAYDVWRLVRLINPATAVTNEARERLSRAALQWGREQVSRHLAGAFVEEVGRAAIDLYGGRLKAASPSAAPVPTRRSLLSRGRALFRRRAIEETKIDQ